MVGPSQAEDVELWKVQIVQMDPGPHSNQSEEGGDNIDEQTSMMDRH